MKLQFAEFSIDSDRRQVLRARTPVHLSRKAFDALCVLLEKRPNAVSKEELHERLWPGTFVVDANLSVTIAEIRRALNDDAQAPRFIRTVHRVGYAFCGEAVESALDASRAVSPRAWLLWNMRVLPLHDGANLIGRDPGCAVWLDVTGVSRRHAELALDGDAAVITDLGSKNGTFVNGALVSAPTPVHDGDRIQLGPTVIDFRTSASASATETVRMARPKKRDAPR